MNLEAINGRVDAALRDNRRAEFIVIAMALGVFGLGAGIVLVAYWFKNPYVGGGTFLCQSFLYWPIREILRLRKDNLVLQTVPVLLAELPQKEATLEIRQLAAYIRNRK
jgi:hypothetical protein